MAQSRSKTSTKRIGRPFGRPFLYRLRINNENDITSKGVGTVPLLDVTVPTDTEGGKTKKDVITDDHKDGLDKHQILLYWEALKVISFFITLAVIFIIIEIFTGD